MKKIKFMPISSKVILKKIEKEEFTEGGIVVPENLRDSYRKNEASVAKVLAVGPGLDEFRRFPNGGMDSRVGDIVLYSSYEGLTFKLEGQEFLSISEKFIIAKVGEAEDDMEP